MGVYAGFVAGSTPVAGVANAVLESASGGMATVKELMCSGQDTTSTAMRTLLARDSAVGTGSRTAGNTQKYDQHMAAAAVFFSTTYATLQPTIVAGALVGFSWNSHGGVVRWLADPGELITIYDASAANASIEVRAAAGTGTSSYLLVWAEP